MLPSCSRVLPAVASTSRRGISVSSTSLYPRNVASPSPRPRFGLKRHPLEDLTLPIIEDTDAPPGTQGPPSRSRLCSSSRRNKPTLSPRLALLRDGVDPEKDLQEDEETRLYVAAIEAENHYQRARAVKNWDKNPEGPTWGLNKVRAMSNQLVRDAVRPGQGGERGGKALRPANERDAAETEESVESDPLKETLLRKAAEMEGYDPEEAATVYAGPVLKEITEEVLRDIFKTYGEVAEIQMPIEGQVGYARIRYTLPSVARMVACMHSYNKLGIRLLVRSCVHGRLEKPVYLGKPGSILGLDGLPRPVTQKEIRRTLRWFGLIEYVHLPRNEQGKTMRYGYVQYFNESSADEAIEASEESPIVVKGRALRLTKLPSHSEPSPPSRSLFVGDLPKDITLEDVMSLFSGLAHIAHARIRIRQNRNFLPGQAFIDFISITEAQKVLDMHHLIPFIYQDQELKMNFADEPIVEPSAMLWVAGFDKKCNLPDIKEAFHRHVEGFRYAFIHRTYTGESKGSGFVYMNSIEAAAAALADHLRRPFHVGGSKVEMNFAKDAAATSPNRVLYITDFGDGGKDLRPFFKKYKRHISKFVVKKRFDKTQFAIADFFQIEKAQEAMEELSGKQLPNGRIPIIKYSTKGLERLASDAKQFKDLYGRLVGTNDEDDDDSEEEGEEEGPLYRKVGKVFASPGALRQRRETADSLKG